MFKNALEWECAEFDTVYKEEIINVYCFKRVGDEKIKGDKAQSPHRYVSALLEVTKQSSNDDKGSAPQSDQNLINSNLNTADLGSVSKR